MHDYQAPECKNDVSLTFTKCLLTGITEKVSNTETKMNYISSACISTYGKAFTKVREVSNAYPGADSPEGYHSDQSADPPEEQPSCSTADC